VAIAEVTVARISCRRPVCDGSHDLAIGQILGGILEKKRSLESVVQGTRLSPIFPLSAIILDSCSQSQCPRHSPQGREPAVRWSESALTQSQPNAAEEAVNTESRRREWGGWFFDCPPADLAGMGNVNLESLF